MTETNISPKKFPKLFNSGKRRRGGRYLVSSNIKAFAAPLPNSVSILIPLAFVRLFTRCLQYWLKAFLPQSVFGDCEQKDDGTPGPTLPPHPTPPSAVENTPIWCNIKISCCNINDMLHQIFWRFVVFHQELLAKKCPDQLLQIQNR